MTENTISVLLYYMMFTNDSTIKEITGVRVTPFGNETYGRYFMGELEVDFKVNSDRSSILFCITTNHGNEYYDFSNKVIADRFKEYMASVKPDSVNAKGISITFTTLYALELRHTICIKDISNKPIYKAIRYINNRLRNSIKLYLKLTGMSRSYLKEDYL